MLLVSAPACEPLTWNAVEGTPTRIPLPCAYDRVPASPFLWVCLEGCLPWLLLLAVGPWPFFPSTWSSEPGLCSTRSLSLAVIGLQGATACSNQLKPRGEIYCWDAGMSHGP